MPHPRPNILLITTDQQRYDHLGLMGLKAVPTPHMDRLGREGIHFRRAYCPSPLCTPSRVSLLTGQYPSHHMAYSIGVTADPFPRPTLGDLLGEAGYATALFGKTHFVRREDEVFHLTGQRKPPGDFFRTWTGPYLGFETCKVSTGHTTNHRPGMHYREFLEASGVDYRPWFPQLTGDYDHNQCGVWNIPPEYHDTSWVAGLTCDYIRDADRDKPWFAFVNFQDPHEPYVCPEPYFSRVKMDEAPACEGLRPGEFDDKPDIYRMALEKEFGDLNDGSIKGEIHGGAVTERSTLPSVFGEPEKEKQKKAALQATLGMIGFLDEQLGRILASLEETGQAENTVLLFTSDHGELHGHHGLWGKGAAAYEDCQRVPLLVWGPSRVEARGSVDALTSLVDLPRTILQLSGVDLPQEIQGVDLGPVLDGSADRVQDAVLVEMRGTQQTFNQHTLITDRYKLVVYKHTAAGELYDLSTDPDQYDNLWDQEAHAPLRARLLLRLAQWHMEQEPHGQSRVSFA